MRQASAIGHEPITKHTLRHSPRSRTGHQSSVLTYKPLYTRVGGDYRHVFTQMLAIYQTANRGAALLVPTAATCSQIETTAITERSPPCLDRIEIQARRRLLKLFFEQLLEVHFEQDKASPHNLVMRPDSSSTPIQRAECVLSFSSNFPVEKSPNRIKLVVKSSHGRLPTHTLCAALCELL